MAKKGETVYSETVKGHARNWRRDARFDKTDGFIGISMFEDGKCDDRVLLSPQQIRELFKFVGRRALAVAARRNDRRPAKSLY